MQTLPHNHDKNINNVLENLPKDENSARRPNEIKNFMDFVPQPRVCF